MKKLYASLSLRQRLSILAAVLAVAGGIAGLTRWKKENSFRPLFTSMSAEDAGAVVGKLKQANVEYRLNDNGATVLVPADRLSELRLQMALEGLPKTGRMGFELFDKTNFGLTDFAERINYRRALEGELERSMGHLAEIEQARVHLTFPKESVFLEARQPAKASIMLQLRPGARLSAQNVQAVCHLVSSAVEGLAPEAVSVLDTRGNLLNRPRRASGDPLEASEATLEFRHSIERDLLAKVRATLEPLVGAGRFQAGVSVDCDFSSGEQSEETFDPSKSVALSSQRTEDGGAALATAGIPGTASNLPRPASAPAAAATGPYSRRTENLTYQTSRVVRHTRQPQGSIRRLSAAVLIDQDVRWEGPAAAPRRVLVAPSPEKLKTIRDLVAGVVNFNATRGDQLVVETLPFEATLRSAPPEAPVRPGAPQASPGFGWPPDKRLALLAGAAAGLLLLLAAAAWMLARRKRRQAPQAAAALSSGTPPETGLAEAPAEPEVPAGPSREQIESEVLRALKMPAAHTQKAEILIRELRGQVTKDAPGATQVLRMWLRGM